MAAPDFAAILGVNPFFAGLGKEPVAAIAELCVTRRLGADETLFLKGDPGDALYAVRQGQIRIGTGTGAGKRLTLNVLGPGDVFGEIALLDGKSRTADAVASEPTVLFMILRRDFLSFLERTPAVSIRLVELLCERVRWMSERVEEATLMPLHTRLARRLLALAEDFGAEVTASQEDLAIFVGATRESVNRQLQVWRRAGIVDLGRGRLRVVDAAGLATEANSFHH